MLVFTGRMGNTKEALQLITNELGDVNQAIEFCKEHNERELWEDLITYSIDKPSQCVSKAVRDVYLTALLFLFIILTRSVGVSVGSFCPV